MCTRVLEVGCGDGSTLVWLREAHGARWLAGVELYPAQAAVARTRLDMLIEGDIETMAGLPADAEGVDLVLCLDVLEHLRDPWRVVANLTRLLRPGGAMIVSLPNLRFFKALGPLVLGDFRYRDSGVMDRTHLRFFTRRTAVGLVESGGLMVDRVASAAAYRGRLQWLRRIVLPLGLGFLDQQYVVRGVRP